MRGILKYRKQGNCFATCIVNGCILLQEQRLQNSSPELQIFDTETLYSPKYVKELQVGLNFLINNDYWVEIIDPGPWDPWGENINNCRLQKRGYKETDILAFSKDGWCIIMSVLDSNNKHQHGILIYCDTIYDPETDEKWNNPQNIQHLKKYLPPDPGFLIAFKKIGNRS